MSLSDDDDLLAGEFVLGTLDADARAAATARTTVDAEFAAAVLRWEDWLLRLEEAGADVPPPSALWPAILARLQTQQPDGSRDESAAVILRLDRGLRTWRRVATAAMALAACLALWIGLLGVIPRSSAPSLVAVLQPADRQPAFLVRADLRDKAMAVEPVAAQPLAGKSFELWVITPALGAPRSLGVIGAGGVARTALPDIGTDALTKATYAVTIEPEGGSPDGRPSGAPVYVGHLIAASAGSP